MKFDRTFNSLCGNNAGPLVDVIDLNLPRYDLELYLEAWISNFGSSNVHLFEGVRSLSDCQYQLGAGSGGATDMLMTVTSAGPSRVRLPDNVSRVTVMFEAENTSGQNQIITVRVHQ